MKIEFSFFMVTPESVELGAFIDEGLYNLKTSTYWSARDKSQYEKALLAHDRYWRADDLDTALAYADILNCGIPDYYPIVISDRLSLSSPVEFTWISPGRALCHKINFTDLSESEFIDICNRVNLPVRLQADQSTEFCIR